MIEFGLRPEIPNSLTQEFPGLIKMVMHFIFITKVFKIHLHQASMLFLFEISYSFHEDGLLNQKIDYRPKSF